MASKEVRHSNPIPNSFVNNQILTSPPPHLKTIRRTAITALAAWPKDPLRPTAQLGEVLSARLSQEPPKFAATSTPPQQVNAILSLLSNRYAKRYALTPEQSASGGMMRPRSNPGYYDALIKDLEEIPGRTWWGKMGIKVKGMFRWT